jgi:hypothetical protein
MKHPSIAAETAPQGRVVPIDSKATEWPILTPVPGHVSSNARKA